MVLLLWGGKFLQHRSQFKDVAAAVGGVKGWEGDNDSWTETNERKALGFFFLSLFIYE